MFFSIFNNRTRNNTTQLVRVWRATGNPRTPLAAVWLTPAQAATLTAADTATEGGLRLCA
jgi:hypothetical protein